MRLLVVTPTLGRSPHLAAAVDSVARTQIDLEHVLVAPRDAVDRLRVEFADCTLVAETSANGMYAAIDAGVRGAGRWDWFSYLNDDDLLKPDFTDVAQSHMLVADPLAIAYGNVDWIDAKGASLGRMPIERSSDHVPYVMKLGLAPLTQQGALVSHELYMRLGGFDASLHLAADFDFWVRALAAGALFRYYPADVASWRIHAAQLSADRCGVQDQTRRVAATVPVQASRSRLRWELLRFRLLNATRYLERRRLTGSWRSEALFAAAEQV